MFNLKWREGFYCAVCKEPLEMQMMDELHDGEVKIYLEPCKTCAAQQERPADGATWNCPKCNYKNNVFDRICWNCRTPRR